jgi:predicted Zn-dependent protease
VRAALVRAGTNPRGLTNRDVFLTRIDGLTYGDDPAQGVVDGRNFIHPAFRLAFQAPVGFSMSNGAKAVSISGQSGKGELTSAAYNGDLDAYVRTVFSGLSTQQQIAPDSVQTTTVNGIKASYGTKRVNSGGTPVDVIVFAYEFGPSQAFHFTTISQAGQATQFDPMFRSVRRISASEAATVKARKLRVTTVRSGDTIQAMAARMAYSDNPTQRFLVLNGLAAGTRLVPGQKVKLVVY